MLDQLHALLHQLIEQHARIAVWGFGLEGRTTLQRLLETNPATQVTILEANPEVVRAAAPMYPSTVRWLAGLEAEDSLPEYDLIFKAPGISTVRHRAVFPDLARRLTSQTALALQLLRDRMVAITGTKGKSTTTTLVYRSLKAHAPDTVLMGNMGIPFFEAVQHIGRRGWVVAELSSHQLEFVSISPRIGVFLNLFPEHLDHYVDYNAYGEAKYNILRYQQSTDWAFVSYGQPEVVELLRRHPLRSQVIPIGHPSGVHLAPDGVYLAFERLVHREAPRHLPGDHNLLNGGVAAAVARQLGVPEHIWQAVITDFEGLPHRLQYLGLRHGLHWYNDSISTIPQATLAALEALQPVETLLVGGMDRGVDVEPLIQGLLNRTDLRHLICLPTTGHALADTLSSAHLPFEVYRSADLAEAVACARIVTPPSGKVVLSPAAASYGVFRNFEHRGEVFNQLISQG